MFAKPFPRDLAYFDLLDAQMGRAVDAASVLVDAVRGGVVDRTLLERSEGIARAAGEATRTILDHLEGRGGASAVHGEGRRLATRVDGIAGCVHTLVKRLHLYRLAPSDKDLAGFSSVIEESVRELAGAARRLRGRKDRQAVAESCRAIGRLVKVGEAMRDEALANLFDTERDAIAVIKWKEIYDEAGAIIALCGEASDVVSSIAGTRAALSP